MILETLIKIDVPDLSFGLPIPSTYSVKITPYLDVLGSANPVIQVTPNSSNPFSVSVNSTDGYHLVFSLDKKVAEIEPNKGYPVVLTSGGASVTIQVFFMYSEDYRATDWPFSDQVSTVGNSFKLREFGFNAGLKIGALNCKFRMIMAFLSTLKSRMDSLFSKYNSRHALSDVIQTAIYGGTFPAGTTVAYSRNPNGDVTSIDITSNGVLMRVDNTYTMLDTVVDQTEATPPFVSATPNVSSKAFLSETTVWRMGSLGTSPAYRYRICKSVYSYTNITRTSQMNSKITEPVISSVTVVE